MRRRGLLLALLLGGCISVPTAVRDVQLAVESQNSVYLLDATGGATRVLARRRVPDRGDPPITLYDAYFEPSLSPDRTQIACIRLRNYAPYGGRAPREAPAELAEVVLVRIADGAERVVMQAGPGKAGRTWILGPVWSPDGRSVFFGADRRIWAYRLGAGHPETLVVLPAVFAPSPSRGRHYLRVSAKGERLLALLRPQRWDEYLIAEVDATGATLVPRWSGVLATTSRLDIDRPLPAAVDDDIAEALFGAREWPVFEPRASPDRRFYFFGRFRQGPLGRRWVAGYDRESGTEFEVRTMWRTIWWE